MEVRLISVKAIEPNKGQVDGLPQNPRFIRDERYEALKKSIQDYPEGLSLRELIVYPYGKKYVVVGGNMRLRACKELGYETMPCKVLDTDTPPDELRRIAIMDNVSFGQNDWDILGNEYDEQELADFGMELDWLTNAVPEPPDPSPDPFPHDPEPEPAASPKNDAIVVQITFDTEDDRDRFVQAYGDVISGDYNAHLSKY